MLAIKNQIKETCVLWYSSLLSGQDGISFILLIVVIDECHFPMVGLV
jgi:hypothetical protein